MQGRVYYIDLAPAQLPCRDPRGVPTDDPPLGVYDQWFLLSESRKRRLYRDDVFLRMFARVLLVFEQFCDRDASYLKRALVQCCTFT